MSGICQFLKFLDIGCYRKVRNTTVSLRYNCFATTYGEDNDQSIDADRIQKTTIILIRNDEESIAF